MTAEKTGIRELKVAEIMHRGCIMVGSDATIAEAIRKMRQAKVSSLIVKPRRDGDAFGILTRRDIVEKALCAGPKRCNFSERRVYELMTKPLVTVSPGLKVKYAVRLMEREGVRRLPVFDGDEMVGILSNTDVFNRLPGDGARHR